MRIGIIGCGNMGQAILKGITARGWLKKNSIYCYDRDSRKLRFLRSFKGVRLAKSNNEVVQICAVIILAVKPQDVAGLLREISVSFKQKALISICAGVTTQRLERYLGKVSIVRVMPNMPARILQGISVIAVGKYARSKDKRLARSIFSCIGEVLEIEERLMDAVTAISGSGPAYFFYLVEILIKTAQRMGISERTARRLAIQTARGSVQLLRQSRAPAADWRRRVTSPGGTTAAAFAVFKRKALADILAAGFRQAAARSRQLSRALE